MGVNKDIGKAYNERLKKLEASPDENVWEKIQNTLETKKKTKVFPFWLRIVGAGLGILLLSGIVYKMSVENNYDPSSIEKNENTNTPSDKTIIPLKNDELLISDTNSIDQTEASDISDTFNEKNSNKDSNSHSSSQINNETLENSNITNKSNDNSIYSTNKGIVQKSKNTSSLNDNNSIKNSENSVADNRINELNNNSLINNNADINNSKKNTSILNPNVNLLESQNTDTEKNNTIVSNTNSSEIKNLNNDPENKIDLEKELIKNLDSVLKKDTLLIASKKDSIPRKKLDEKKSEWEVGVFITPTYFGSLTKGSSLGEIIEDKDKQTNITLSYRVLGNFKLSEKLTLRTGFGNTKLSYSTIDATKTDSNGELENLGEFPGISYDFIQLNEIYTNDLLGNSSSIDFKQELTYFEIPVELIYRIPKNKIEWKVITGASVFKLSKNEIIAESSQGSYYIGGANNLSKYSYSINLGGGFDYKVSNKVNLIVEPIFKYHINTFSRKAYNFKPISAGISFGATYKF